MSKFNNNNCLVVVPMKDPSTSKSRLDTVLNAAQRKSLATLLYKRTLSVLKQLACSRSDIDIAVVTNSAYAKAIADETDIIAIQENETGSLSKAADVAAQWAIVHNYSSLCIIPADLAAPDGDEISKLISTGQDQNCPVICPSTDLGTNAIYVSPPNLIKFQYGKNSSLSHMKRLEEAGATPIIMPLESLRFDIDTQECLEKAVRKHEDLQSVVEVSK